MERVAQISQIAQKYLVSSFKIQVSGLAESAESAEHLWLTFPSGRRAKPSGFRILGHTESTENTEILGFKFQDSSFRSRRKGRERRNITNTNDTNLTNYDAGGKGFTVHGS